MRGILDNKAIVITGAGQGLGRAFALRCGSQGAGLVINDINPDLATAVAQEVCGAGGSAVALAGSVSDWNFVELLMNSCVSAYGSLDGLINNAAIHYLELPWNESEAQIRALIEVNVLGAMYCGIHALKAMITQQSGSIVNVTSGAHLGVPLHSSYGASKGAVASLTYGWAGEAMPHNVRVNAISPSAKTPMAAAAAADHQRFGSSNAVFEGLPSAEAVAPIVSYLVSDLSQGITGQNFSIGRGGLGVVSHPQLGPPTIAPIPSDEILTGEVFDSALRQHLKPFTAFDEAYAWVSASPET